MPYFIIHSGFSSVFTFAIRIFPPYSFASLSRVGATILHGLHHGAQKSTITGMDDCSTVFSNAASVTWIGSFDMVIHLLLFCLKRQSLWQLNWNCPQSEKKYIIETPMI